MAGAMRRMGIYLGLVEDDDPRGYGRYDSRQSDHSEYDRRYGRYADEQYDGDYADGYADDLEAEDVPAAREPEPLPVRRDRTARPIGLAPAGASAAAPSGGSRISAMGSGPVGATVVRVGTALFGDRPLASGETTRVTRATAAPPTTAGP